VSGATKRRAVWRLSAHFGQPDCLTWQDNACSDEKDLKSSVLVMAPASAWSQTPWGGRDNFHRHGCKRNRQHYYRVRAVQCRTGVSFSIVASANLAPVDGAPLREAGGRCKPLSVKVVAPTQGCDQG